jgi:hypothetical protein
MLPPTMLDPGALRWAASRAPVMFRDLELHPSLSFLPLHVGSSVDATAMADILNPQVDQGGWEQACHLGRKKP